MAYKILIALDFSKLGQQVAAYGSELAQRFAADITYMHVVPEPNVIFSSYAPQVPVVMDADLTELKRTAERKLRYYVEEFCQQISKDRSCNIVVEMGDSSQCIIEYAKQHAFDMIVLGYRGHSTIDALLVGSTANKVTRYAPCSVLIYRPDKASEKK